MGGGGTLLAVDDARDALVVLNVAAGGMPGLLGMVTAGCQMGTCGLAHDGVWGCWAPGPSCSNQNFLPLEACRSCLARGGALRKRWMAARICSPGAAPCTLVSAMLPPCVPPGPKTGGH